jgi:hypothetical protein
MKCNILKPVPGNFSLAFTWIVYENTRFSIQFSSAISIRDITLQSWLTHELSRRYLFKDLLGRYLIEILIYIYRLLRTRNSVVNTATGYRLNGRKVGVRVPVRSRIFLFFMSSRPALRSIQSLSNGYRDLFSGVKRTGHEAGRSPPASDKVKKMWMYTSTPPYAIMA